MTSWREDLSQQARLSQARVRSHITVRLLSPVPTRRSVLTISSCNQVMEKVCSE